MTLGVVGGTGLASLAGLEVTRREVVNTPWGEPSGPLVHGRLAGRPIVFLARHGHAHRIPPHRVNYRANVWSLRQIGVERVIAVAAVGGIHAALRPGRIAFPEQLIDYTHGRGHTFFEEDLEHVVHVDLTEPYARGLRDALVRAAREIALDAFDGGTYAATQGPRLETAAEIDRLERDGCDMVGMTGMPEAGLAREAQLEYATCAVVANAAAGRAGGPLSMAAIRVTLDRAMTDVHRLLERAVALL